jgi:acetyltransferase-like isoleucine patch superfamily enzyme
MTEEKTARDVEKWKVLFRAAYEKREKELLEIYHRSLPFQDAMFDRDERARKLGFGNGATIYNSALVYGNVVVGERTWIGPYVVLDGSGGGISIGSTCSISAGVHVYTHDTVGWALSGGRHPFRRKPVKIGDCCYIGSQSVILAGVEIGDRCVVAANSMVNENVPPETIVGGTPARKIGHVEYQGGEPALVLNGNAERGRQEPEGVA